MNLRDYNDEKVRLFAAHITGEEEDGPLTAERTERILGLLEDDELERKYKRWIDTGKTEGNNRAEDVIQHQKEIFEVKKSAAPDKTNLHLGIFPHEKSKRNQQVVADYKNGMKTPALSEKYGLSRERVCQILRPHGLFEEQRAASLEARAKEFREKAEAKKKRRELMDELFRLVKDEKISYAQASDRLGVKRGIAYQEALKRGLTHTNFSGYGRWGHNRGSRRDERAGAITALRRAGFTWAEVDQQIGKAGMSVFAKRYLPELFSQEELELNNEARLKLFLRTGKDEKKSVDETVPEEKVRDLLKSAPAKRVRLEETEAKERLEYFNTLKEEGFTSSEIAMMASNKFHTNITRNVVLGVLFRDKNKREKTAAADLFWEVAQEADKINPPTTENDDVRRENGEGVEGSSGHSEGQEEVEEVRPEHLGGVAGKE